METLIIDLDKTSTKPLYEQLYLGLKKAIIHNEMKVGTKLPSKRQLADFLNISQTTIELAYGQLLAEGYIISKPRVGFYVAEIDELPYIEKGPMNHMIKAPLKSTLQYDFHPGKIDTDSFPISIWRKYAKDLFDPLYKEYLQVGEPQGEFELRAEISDYLYQSRGIICRPEQIVIGSGTEHLLPMILRLVDQHSIFALENPGYSAIPRNHLQYDAIPIPVDSDGLIVDELEKTNANIVYITPSHQFPTGAVLSAARRTQLLKWAAQNENRYIIEDDYDSEFRYIGKPISALHGLDQNDKVIYMSTFTKSLMPSLRVAYFVLPPVLLQVYRDIFSYYSATVPRFDQYLLANFMREGHFAKHLNRMRKIYRKKHDRLTSIIKNDYPDIEIKGDHAGMHILISLPLEKTEKELKQIAKEAGIGVYPVSDYLLKSIQYDRPTFLIGFGGIILEDIDKAIHQLMDCWGIQRK